MPDFYNSNAKMALTIDLQKALPFVGEIENDDTCEGNIMIQFQLPDGKTIEHRFNQEHDVSQMKATLELEAGLDFAMQEMRLNGKLMPNPLSLADFPTIAANQSATIIVTLRDG